MKSKPKSKEYSAFEDTLRRVLETNHEDLKKKLSMEKAAKKRPSVSSRVSSGKD